MDYLRINPDMYNVPWSADQYNGMPYRTLGNSGLKASDIGLGTWKFGYPETGDGARVNESTAFGILDRAAEIGVTFWDTANRYNAASGNSERIIGKWFKMNPDQRRNIVLATKVFGGMDGKTPNHSGLSRLNIIESVYACLKRLQTDYIDLLYFHAFDASVPIEESLTAIEDIVAKGIVRYFAVSNFTVDQLEQYKACGKYISCRCRIIAVENYFNILFREEKNKPGVLSYCASNGLSYVAWEPLARGLLTGRYLNTDAKPGDRLYDEGEASLYGDKALETKIQRLYDLAKGWGVELSSMVLSYMLNLPGMGPVIPSVSSISQLEHNAAAAGLILSDEQCMQIKEVCGL